MIKRRPVWVGVFILFFLLNGNAKPRVGVMAPDFSIKAASGKQFNIKNYWGRIVVLEWTNHLCAGVRKQYVFGNMQKLQRYAAKNGVVWVRVVSSGVAKPGFVTGDVNRRLMTAQGARVSESILDFTGELGKLYGVTKTPEFFVIDRRGRIAYRGAVDSVRSSNPRDVDVADNYVRMAVEDLLANRPVRIQITSPYGCAVAY
jgi:peroxiredoxin